MIHTLKIKLLDGIYFEHDWQGEIEIAETNSLEQLHFCIQEAVDFEADHLYDFSVASSERSSDREMYECDDNGRLTIRFKKLLPLADGKKIFYCFDFGDNWLFQLSKSRKKPKQPEENEDYPRLISEKGIKPVQYPDFDE